MRQIVFLGTGNGMPIASSCSSLLIKNEKTNILIDVGGGHDILVQFHRANIDPTTVDNIFISHYDSDHILGIVPLVRAFHRWGEPKMRKIFCSAIVKEAIESLFTFVAKKHYHEVKPYLEFVIVNDGDTFSINGWEISFFDLQSNKTHQLGCSIIFEDQKKLSFLGDEPLKEHCLDRLQGTDILIHEAFCLDDAKDTFKPHEKNHGTVKEAAMNATKIGAKQLVFYHMEDNTLANRKVEYLTEAKEYFHGEVFVPVDLDTFEF